MTGIYSELDDRNFDKAKSSNKLVLVDFWGEGCVPCKMMEPIIEKTEKKYKEKMMVLKGNINKCSKAVQQFRIMSIPTIILFKEGKPVERFTGMVREDVLQKKINDNLD